MNPARVHFEGHPGTMYRCGVLALLPNDSDLLGHEPVQAKTVVETSRRCGTKPRPVASSLRGEKANGTLPFPRRSPAGIEHNQLHYSNVRNRFPLSKRLFCNYLSSYASATAWHRHRPALAHSNIAIQLRTGAQPDITMTERVEETRTGAERKGAIAGQRCGWGAKPAPYLAYG